MLTNPNTLGLFEEDIAEIAAAVHEVGGLLYYDGANLNAILGVVRPGDMGFDIVHMNLHKTFAVPHGGGGPGRRPGGRVARGSPPFLPGPAARCARDDGTLRAGTTPERSIGRVHGWHGNALALARAYSLHPGQRRRRPAPGGRGGGAQRQLAAAPAAGRLRHPLRPAQHARVRGVDHRRSRRRPGSRPSTWPSGCSRRASTRPTVYFPLIVDEALMIEPTETESPQTLEALAEALERIAAATADGGATQAPRTTPVGRVDEARAARQLIPTWDARP